MTFRLLSFLALGCGLAFSWSASAQTSTPEPTAAEREAVQRIREEGLAHSQVMTIASYLTDVIGPRLTGSPELKRANEWTRLTMTGWGLTNAHLEPWPFGRGWSLDRFSAQIVEPYAIPLVARPRSWSTGLKKPVTGPVIYFNPTNTADMARHAGKLKGAFVLTSPPRNVPLPTEPMARRLTETNLQRLASATADGGGFRRRSSPPPEPARSTNAPAAGERGARPASGAGSPPPEPVRRRYFEGGPGGSGVTVDQKLKFLSEQGVAAMVSCTMMGDGGVIMVGNANVLPPRGVTNSPSAFGSRVSAWATNAVAAPPQIVLGVEDYNRLVRMIEQGVRPRMEVDLRVRFHSKDQMAYNTVAEIPGSDKAEEVVLLGGHLDSYHGGTGATDNAAGVAVAMEAVRILRALNLQPRRTVRVGLWSGEEQGLYGSRAYVREHIGTYTNIVREGAPEPDASAPRGPGGRRGGDRRFVAGPEFEKLSVYFNLDNGGGKVRGIYLQGNEAVRPYFTKWLEDFRDLGAETVTASNTYGTDHLPFDEAGVPAFQFIQDPLDYDSRTHHTTADVYDRFVTDDLKQAATIMATFVYHAAMLDERLPRKAAQGR